MQLIKSHNQCSQIAIIKQTTTKIKNTLNTIALNIDHFYHNFFVTRAHTTIIIIILIGYYLWWCHYLK
jgi:hypothetical protein